MLIEDFNRVEVWCCLLFACGDTNVRLGLTT